MKTTFDLPEPLMRRAKAAAANQGRPLRDLVAEAIEAKLSAEEATACADTGKDNPWKAFTQRLQELPDGTYYNPDGIDDEDFFHTLEALRADRQMWQPRGPLAAPALTSKPTATAAASASPSDRGRPCTSSIPTS